MDKLSRTTALAATAVIALGALTGCSSGTTTHTADRVRGTDTPSSAAPTASTPSVAPSAAPTRSKPSSGGSATPTPPPDGSATPTPAPAAVLTHDGYGPIRLGMSLAEVKRTGAIKIVRRPNDADPCAQFRMRADPDVTGYVSTRHGVVAIFPGEGARTAEGIHIGSSRSATRSTYPQLRHEINGSYARLSAKGAQPEVDYRFTFKNGTGPVDALFLQRSDQDCYE